MTNMEGKKGLNFSLHASINEIDEHTWNQLAPKSVPTATHKFIRLCELSAIEDAQYRHVLIHDRRGLAATVTLTFMSAPLDALSPRYLRRAVHRVRASRLNFMRLSVIFCGLPVSFGQAPLNLRRDADRPAILKLVDGLMREFAEETGSGVLVFKEFMEPAYCEGDELTERSYMKLPSLPYHELSLKWSTFCDYLNAMRADYRRQIRQDTERASKAGLTLERRNDFGDECHRIHALYKEIMQNTENWLEILPLTFFEQLNQLFARETHAVLARHQGTIVGSAILLKSGRSITFLLAGIDQRFNRKFHFYPHLLAGVIADAIDSRADYLNLGQTSDRLKSRFGSTVTKRWIYLRHKQAPVNWLIRRSSPLLFPEPRALSRRVFRRDVPGHATLSAPAVSCTC